MSLTQLGPFFCSWSGGKDCCLALYHAIRNGGTAKALVTMFTEGGERSRSHGLPISVIQQQAAALGIPLTVHKSSWDDYEQTFLSALREFKGHGVDCGVFGDIDLASHLEWVERVCSSTGINPYEPLWRRSRHDLLEEFFHLGFTATIVAVKQGTLDTRFLGQTLEKQIVLEMKEAGIDLSGEGGEYHTVVTNGPLFSFPIQLESKGRVVRDGYCFLDVAAV
jgi:diphthine-ammonia ligase